MAPSGGMAPSGDQQARVISRHLKVLLPPFSSSSHKLRISDELARHLEGNTASAGGTALVVDPFGGKVWRVEVGRDGGGAFLGRGWPEFVAAHGIGALWFMVFRHEGGGVLTIKAFDTSFCLHEFCRPIKERCRWWISKAAVHQGASAWLQGKDGHPSWICETPHCQSQNTNSRLAVSLNLCGKKWDVQVRSGHVFFSGGWPRFLDSNGITQGEILLLRYEGDMVFTVKVFGLNGCQKSFKSTNLSGVQETVQSNRMEMTPEQDAPASSSSTGKRKTGTEKPSIQEAKRSTRCAAPLYKAPATARSKCTCDLGPPAWIKKEINSYALKPNLSLVPSFCKAIGILKPCEITLRTLSTGSSSTRSWQVSVWVNTQCDNYSLGKGWTAFRRENRIKEGDVCTFNIINTTLWHIDIARRS